MMDLSVLESLFMNLNEGRFKVVSMYIDELQMYLLESIVELENKNIYSCNCEKYVEIKRHSSALSTQISVKMNW